MTMTSKPKCKYGASCYRKNPTHMRDYDHSSYVRNRYTGAKIEEEFDKILNREISDVEEAKPVPVKGKGLKRKSTDGKSTEMSKKKNEGKKQKNTLDAFFSKKEEPSCDSDKGAVEKLEILDNETTSKQVDVKSNPKDMSDTALILLNDDEAHDKLKQLYDMEMPNDLYQFWRFCKNLDSEKPANALQVCGLHLVGPFDILSGKYHNVKDGTNFHLNHRYYYDPPEFMTLIAGKDDQFHLGYFRDDPKELPVFVASNLASDNCLITAQGENLFSAVKSYLEERFVKTKQKSISSLLKKLCTFAKEEGICLDLKTTKLKQRQKKVVCKTFHGAGLVVPVDKNDVGYRPVPETAANLKQMLKKIVDSKSEDERDKNLEPLEEIITCIQFANDECDYGEGLELGLDLFSFGSESLHPFISTLLCTGYRLLKRDLYANIVREFLPLRSKDKPYIISQ